MEMKTGEIQPAVADSWKPPDTGWKESQVIPPVVKAEGGAAEKVKDRKQNPEAPEAPVKSEYLAQVVENIQRYLHDTLNVNLDFQIDANTKEMVVRVLNRETGEVVRQIPSEDVVRLREKLEEFRGALFNGKV